jgi:hypothetical protein
MLVEEASEEELLPVLLFIMIICLFMMGVRILAVLGVVVVMTIGLDNEVPLHGDEVVPFVIKAVGDVGVVGPLLKLIMRLIIRLIGGL